MKNYGKRTIPRNTHEFEDLIGPSYSNEDYSLTISLLTSYWKRKGKSSSSNSDITGGLLSSSFNGAINIDPCHLLCHFYVGPDGIAYSEKELFQDHFKDSFFKKYKSSYKFLKVYFKSLEWLTPTNLNAEYHTLKYYQNIAPKELKYKRGWIYGFENNRIDILVTSFIEFELKKLVEEATQSTRVALGLSPFTTQWKNEQLLLDLVKTKFPNELVIGQGSPKWLEGQRFDIWLPERNIAVEYNGEQHYRPVDYFGGLDGFIETQKRDEQKRIKCSENGLALLEVDENYKLDDVISWVKKHLD